MAKRTSLDSLPPIVLDEIFLCLDPKSAFSVFLQLCKTCHSVIQGPYLRSRYLKTYFGVQTDYEPGIETLKRVLRQEKQNQPIPFTAIITTGGVDEDSMFYWAQNMFTPGHHSAYCSKENKNNIVVVAVLEPLVHTAPSQEFLNARKTVAGLIRGNRRLRSIPDILPAESSDDLTETELQIVIELFRAYPYVLIPIQPEDSNLDETEWLNNHLPPIRQLLSTITESELSFRDVAVRAEDGFYLERSHDKGLISASNMLFFARNVMVSRQGGYTCPLETFMVFVSEDFVLPESEDFSRFDNLLQISDVQRLAALNGPETLQIHDSPDLIYCEFKRISSNLHPVIWGKFKTRQGTELSVDLEQCFAGKYVYVKLINPENRMAEMRDLHDHTNIDCRFAGLQGFIDRISQD